MKKYRKMIGPSQFATVLGFDEYQTPEQFKIEIENGYLPQQSYATNFGCQHEEIALYYYQKLFNVNIQKPTFVMDPKNRRMGGICDALIDTETGLEIKTHVKDENLLTELPLKFLLQMTGYMYLYHRKKWVLMSCIFNEDHTIKKYTIFTTTWDQVKDRWENQWYPQLQQYIGEAHWII